MQPPRVSLAPPPAAEAEWTPRAGPWPDRRFIVVVLGLLALWPLLLEAVWLLYPLP